MADRVRVPICACPKCQTVMGSASKLDGPGTSPGPQPGDLSVCVVCAEVLAFTDDLGLRTVSKAELQALTQHQLAVIAQAQRDATRPSSPPATPGRVISPEERADIMAKTRETVARARGVMEQAPDWVEGAVVLFLDRDGNLHCGASATSERSATSLKRAIDAIRGGDPAAPTITLPGVARA